MARTKETPRSGVTKRSIRIDDGAYNDLRTLAERRGTTLQDLILDAISNELREDAAKRTADLLRASLHEVMEDRLQQVEYGLRRLIAVVGMEALRTQFVLLNFLVDAGIPKERVDAWREQGHEYAVRQLKNRTKQKASDDL